MQFYTTDSRKYKILPNVWLGTSVEDQKTADERIQALLETLATVRWISVEPLLESILFSQAMHAWRMVTGDSFLRRETPKLHWVVCGGESGPGYRPMNPEWARSIRDQCSLSRIPFFMKQMAGKAPIPDDLLVREYPNAISPERESGQLRIEGI